MMNLWQRRAATIAAILFSLFLAACGGGSSSSGGGGAGTGKTSSIVVQLSPNMAMHRNLMPQSEGASLIASAVLDLLVRNAVAQTAGVKVFVDGIEVGVTDSAGNFAVAVAPGMHTVCINSLGQPTDPGDPTEPGDPTAPGDPNTTGDPNNLDDLTDVNGSSECMEVSVGPDEVVVISGVQLDEGGNIVSGTITKESAFDNIVLFQDPNKHHKTLMCHKGKTISVGSPAAMTGHMVHGDIPGECAGAGPVVNNDATGDGGPSSGPSSGPGAGPRTVTICHRPDGNARTMTVPESAANAHYGHGDTPGPCGVG